MISAHLLPSVYLIIFQVIRSVSRIKMSDLSYIISLVYENIAERDLTIKQIVGLQLLVLLPWRLLITN